nr:unnamed protein product [Callosobruchus analis]
MPGCAAVNCSNSAKKGFIMKRFHETLFIFPLKCGRRLEDSIRKLKANAVPTVFSFSQLKKPRKPPVKRKLSSLKEVKVMTDGAIQVADIAQEDTTTTANIT